MAVLLIYNRVGAILMRLPTSLTFRPLRGALLCAVLAVSSSAESDPADVLLRVRDNVLNTVDRLPRYLCTQTIDRTQYEPYGITGGANCQMLKQMRGTRFIMVRTTADRLRLDVGVAQGGEAYSWVGENRFGDKTLFEIVKDGAVSTGYFQGFLDLVFRSDNADFSFLGGKSQDGRKLVEYAFEVPVEQSHYQFRRGGRAYTTAYEGTLTADPETAELEALTVRSRNLPPEAGSCEVTTIMKYSRWRVNDSDFLLPAETRLEIRDVNGVESQNRTVYTGCHEFVGESTVRFGAPADGHAVPPLAKSPAEVMFPAGLLLSVQLAQDIPVATAAAGDPVAAALAADLKNGRKTLVRQGAPVTCRILRIRRWYNAHTMVVGGFEPVAELDLVLRLESLATPAGSSPIVARRLRVPVEAAQEPRGPGALGVIHLGPLATLDPSLWFARFDHAGDDYVIRSGLTSYWITEAR